MNSGPKSRGPEEGVVNSRGDKGFRKLCPRWELSLQADSMLHMGRWGNPAEDKMTSEAQRDERTRCSQGQLVTGSHGNAGMDRGSSDTEN